MDHEQLTAGSDAGCWLSGQGEMMSVCERKIALQKSYPVEKAEPAGTGSAAGSLLLEQAD